jgi:uncharacterized caspase-like protein
MTSSALEKESLMTVDRKQASAIALALLLSLFSLRAHATDGKPNRIALVIGNAAYVDSESPLKDPVNNAHDVAAELMRDGFDVVIGENLNSSTMQWAFDRFYAKITPGSLSLVFFSGIGLQAGGDNYLIPLDASIWTEAEIRIAGFGLKSIVQTINSRSQGAQIVILDGARPNPFERRFRYTLAGLAAVNPGYNTLAMYSTMPNTLIRDSDSEHRFFVRELIKNIRVPDRSALQSLDQAKQDVSQATDGRQTPFISSASLTDDLFFRTDNRPGR